MPLLVLLLLLLAVPAAESAELRGRVRAGASLSAAASLSVAVDAWACGKDGRIDDPRLRFGPDRGIADVVVRMAGDVEAPPYKAGKQAVVIDQRDCVFVPHLVITTPGVPVAVRNSDRFLHTFRTKGVVNRNVNKAQTGGKEDLVAFAEPEIVTAVCDVHHWMSAVIVVAGHAWTAATDEAGRFVIADLVPGSYRLEFWHELLGTRRATVEVGAGGAGFDLVWEAAVGADPTESLPSSTRP